MGFVTTTGHPPLGFCEDELASLSRPHSLDAKVFAGKGKNN